MSEHRKEQFKEGIKDKTRDREVRATVARKDKRDTALQQRRRVEVGWRQQGTLHVALRQYNVQRLLYQQDVQQLQLLSEMISLSSKTLEDRLEFDKNARRILCVDPEGAGKWEVIELLIQLCGNADVRTPAITCLLNVTAIQSHEHDLDIVMHIKKYGFLKLVYEWSVMATSTVNGITEEQVSMAYDVLSNCLLACSSFCSDIMQCPLLAFYVDPAMYKPEEIAASPVFRLLKAAPTLPSLQFFINVMLQSMVHSQFVVPWHFMFCVWRSLMQTLITTPRPMQTTMESMSLETRLAVQSAVGSIMHIMRILINTRNAEQRDHALQLLILVGMDDFFHQIMCWMRVADKKTLVYLTDICQQLSELNMDDWAIQKSMTRTKCTEVMMQNLNHSLEVVRVNAFVWLGNYMIGNFECVVEMIHAGALNTIVQKIRREGYNVRSVAVYALMAMFHTCNETRCTNMEQSEFATGVMRTLVVVNKMLTWLGEFIDVAGDPTMLVDILRVIIIAIKWDRENALKELEDYGVLDRVALLIHHKDPAVFQFTDEILNLVDNHSQYNEERNTLAIMDTSNLEEGTLVGGFKF